MARAKVLIVKNAIEKFHQEMLKRSSSMNAALARDIYTIYANAQRRRWMTENKSEGPAWPKLNKTYAESKLRRFAHYPGQGTKMMIATSTLVKAATGEDLTYHRRKVAKNRMEIAVTVPYAVYVAEKRPFMEFSERTRKAIVKKMGEYMMGAFR